MEYCKKEHISKGKAVRQGIELLLGEYSKEKLGECMKRTGMTKTGVIRAGIELIYEKVRDNGG